MRPSKKQQKTAEAIFGNRSNWNTALTNFQLDKFARQLELPGWKGVFSRDQIPKKLPEKLDNRETYIVNIQPLNDGRGTHWVSVILDDDNAWYFDSFGMSPVSEVLSRYKNVDITSSTFVMQNLQETSVYCGMISLYVIYSYFYVYDRDFKKTILDMFDKYRSRYSQ